MRSGARAHAFEILACIRLHNGDRLSQARDIPLQIPASRSTALDAFHMPKAIGQGTVNSPTPAYKSSAVCPFASQDSFFNQRFDQESIHLKKRAAADAIALSRS